MRKYRKYKEPRLGKTELPLLMFLVVALSSVISLIVELWYIPLILATFFILVEMKIKSVSRKTSENIPVLFIDEDEEVVPKKLSEEKIDEDPEINNPYTMKSPKDQKELRATLKKYLDHLHEAELITQEYYDKKKRFRVNIKDEDFSPNFIYKDPDSDFFDKNELYRRYASELKIHRVIEDEVYEVILQLLDL